MNISIIGTGIYGIALALNMAENNHNIIMWSENKELVIEFQKNHSLKPITDTSIPDNINVIDNLEIALKSADLIVLVPSAKYISSITKDMQNYYQKDTPICLASKGIEQDGTFLTTIIKENLKPNNIAVLSGPTFAIDLINKEPCALSIGTNNITTYKIINEALANNHLKLEHINDIHSLELSGSIKNVFAIASGILAGLKYTDSTRAFLLTEALKSIKEILVALNFKPENIYSYACIGDLILTCTSPKSRNFEFGKLIGSKAQKEEIDEYLKTTTVEGYFTIKSLINLTHKLNIKVPLLNTIYDIIINNKNPEILPEFLIKN